jgi:tetratricopeptide (TPR) repeat protein
MRTKTIFCTLLFAAIAGGKVNAQSSEITGDTIFVTTEFPVQIKFPSDNILASFTDPAAPYKWTSVGQNLMIYAKSDVGKCSILVVDEGKRHHNFVICYKKDLNPDNLSQVMMDRSTVKKLQQRVKELEERKAAKAALENSAAATLPASPTAKVPSPTSSESKGGGSYYALLEDGDKALKNGELENAQSKYEEVLRIKPDNEFAKKGLANVADKRAEIERKKKKDLDDKITALRANATKAFNAKNYDEALKGYNDALALNPNDVYSKSQVSIIKKYQEEIELKAKEEKEKQAKREAEEKINGIKLTAAKAFSEMRYDDAISSYNQLLAISPSDQFSKNRINEIQKIKVQNELKAKQDAQNKDREETFKTIVSNADKAFDNKEYEVAKAGYLAAKDLKPNDAALEKKISTTLQQIKNKEHEDEYSAAITLGNEAKASGDYEKAKAEYAKALKIFKDRPYAQTQINEIDKTVQSIAAKQLAEKEKQAKEVQDANKYQLAIEKGDKAFINNDFTAAKTAYAEALALRPAEIYPKDKLAEVATTIENRTKQAKATADSMARVSELNKKYALVLQKGKAAFDKNDLENAKKAYTEALALKPNDDEAKNKLDLIEKKAGLVDVSSKYDSAMSRGNIAMADKNYTVALENYKQAVKLKPLERTALSQLQYTQQLATRDSLEQAEKQRVAINKIQEEVRKKRFDDGMGAYVLYENAAQISNYEDQLTYLKHFLNVIPDASELNTYQFNASAKIDFAKKKIQTIRDYLTRIKGSTYQLEAIPYLNQDLEKKYESINFSAPPDEQVMEKIDTPAYNESIKFGKDILAQKPRLSLQDSSNNIKLTCESISFKGDKVCYRFKIQNNSTDEFLTGPMQLSAIKKDGSVIKENADYISSFPIVLPGKEFFLVYQTKDVAVTDKDALYFELSDRLKKTKLKVDVPGIVYNKEKNQKTDNLTAK